MRAIVLAFTLAASAAVAAAAPGFSTLEERMSAEEFQRAGLDKLDAAELAALNAWLQEQARPTAAAAPQAVATQAAAPQAVAVAGDDRRGFRERVPAEGREPIRSRLIGESTGWSYGTVFRLENGQTWRAVERGSRLSGVRLHNPQVEIRQGVMGDWRLKFEDYNTRTRVERIE